MSSADHSSSTAQPAFVPHIIPLRAYYGVFAVLLALTFITITVYRIEMGEKLAAMGVIEHAHAHLFNMVVSMIIATIKATLVAAIFMHLLYDNKLYALCFLASLVFLGVFIIFTMMDTLRRGDLDENLKNPYKNRAVIYTELDKEHAAGEPAGIHKVSEAGAAIAPGSAAHVEHAPVATPHY